MPLFVTMLMAASLAQQDIRPLLREQGFEGPINGREKIQYVGHVRQGRSDYRIYLYRGLIPENLRGVNRLIVILNGTTLVGAYDSSTASKCVVRGSSVICDTDAPGVVPFTKRGPPYEIWFDGYVETLSYGNRLKTY